MSSPHDDPAFSDTEDRVRQALRQHTDEVEISNDAYARLAERVVATEDRGRRSWLPATPSLVAGAAALVLVAGGVALFGLPGRDDAPPSEIAADGGPASTVDVGASGDAGNEPPGATDGGALALGPIRATPFEAAEAFVGLLGIEPAEVVESDDGGATVLTTGEGGDSYNLEVARLDLTEVSDGEMTGWAVRAATTDSVSIDGLAPSAMLSGDSLVVTGRGTGNGGTFDIELRSAVDGSVLYDGFVEAGSLGEQAPYEATIPLVGTERAWLVVTSSGEADDVANAFAAVPISYVGSDDPSTYLVTGITPDDPDGGLVLRAGPSASSEQLDVIPGGFGVNRIADEYPAVNGEDVWWPVTTADGAEGWVNARYLAAGGSLELETLDPVADAFLFAAAQPDTIDGRLPPVSERAGFTVVVGGEVRPATDAIPWRQSEGGGRTLAALVSPPTGARQDTRVTPMGEFVDPANAEIAERYFGGQPWVTATYTGTDGRAHTTHVMVDATPTGLRLIGVILE